MKACLLNSSGDRQLEPVLTPLLFLDTKLDLEEGGGVVSSFPGARILDFGCGNGRLLDAIGTYCPSVIRNLQYVGWDLSLDAVEKARTIAKQSRSATELPLNQRLRSCKIELAPDDLTGIARGTYDAIILVNVLHHLDPVRKLPEFIREAFRIMRENGYLVIEDFFLGEYPEELDITGIYPCPDGIYFGPAELAAMCSSGWRENFGLYRFFKRNSAGKTWYGYTFVLHHSHFAELYSKFSQASSQALPGVKFALMMMKERAKAAGLQNPWYLAYADRLDLHLKAEELDQFDFTSDKRGFNRYYWIQRLYRNLDPYPSLDPYPTVIGGSDRPGWLD